MIGFPPVEVHRGEGPDTQAQGAAGHRVHLLGGAQSRLDGQCGREEESFEDRVHRIAVAAADFDRDLADGLVESHQQLGKRGIGITSRHDLDQRIPLGREEVVEHHGAGGNRETAEDRFRFDMRRVRRQDGGRTADLLQPREDPALDLEVLRRGLDHQAGAPELLVVRREGHPAGDGRRRLGREGPAFLPLGHFLRELGAAPFQRLGCHIHHDDGNPVRTQRLGEIECDVGTDVAGPDHADLVENEALEVVGHDVVPPE